MMPGRGSEIVRVQQISACGACIVGTETERDHYHALTKHALPHTWESRAGEKGSGSRTQDAVMLRGSAMLAAHGAAKE